MPVASFPVYVTIDFETSDYSRDSACAIGMAKLQGAVIVDSFYSLIRPPSSHVRFTHVHGLTWPMLKTAPTFGELWPDIALFIAGTTHFVAHNAPFDKGVLHKTCEAYGITPPAQPFVCTLQQARKQLRLPSHSLGNICQHFGIVFNHHHAGEDAIATAKVFARLQNCI